jgi:hypothetical protein
MLFAFGHTGITQFPSTIRFCFFGYFYPRGGTSDACRLQRQPGGVNFLLSGQYQLCYPYKLFGLLASAGAARAEVVSSIRKDRECMMDHFSLNFVATFGDTLEGHDSIATLLGVALLVPGTAGVCFLAPLPLPPLHLVGGKTAVWLVSFAISEKAWFVKPDSAENFSSASLVCSPATFVSSAASGSPQHKSQSQRFLRCCMNETETEIR